MISAIGIEGFRVFRHFEMSNLGQVNLLVGKNNSGKTSLLEAFYLLTTRGEAGALGQLLWRRGERMLESDLRGQPDLDISHLFTGHEVRVGSSFTLTASNQSPLRSITFEVDEMSEKERAQFTAAPMTTSETALSKLVMRIKSNAQGIRRIPLTRTGGISGEYLDTPRRLSRRPARNEDTRAQYITTESLDGNQLVSLWDKIALTPDEDLVLGALRCLDPEIERIAAQATGPYWGGRSGFIVKHKRYELPIPIGSMGDGMWRMLAMAISITQCRDGVLLIDEIDTGLHHTVMADMWKLIIRSAEKFDVQVFATTHSSDCVTSLAETASEALDYLEALPQPRITLQRIESGQNQAVPYTAEELKMAARHAIEVR